MEHPYILYRDTNEFVNEVNLDPGKVTFCDLETCEDEGLSKGGLYGKIRLFQMFQKGMDKAIIADCFFVDLQAVLDTLDIHTLCFHGGSFDLHTINRKTDKLWLPAGLEDTIYLSRLHFFTKTKFGFYDCLKYAKKFAEELKGIDKSENQKFDWSGPLSPLRLNYAAFDVIYMAQLYDEVEEERNTESYKLDIANLKYAIEYDRRGIPVDRERVKTRLRDVTYKLEEILEEIPCNPASPKQVCELLGSKSSDRDTLMTLSLKGNEMAAKVREARLLTKERMFLMQYDRPKIYGFHNPSGAISGRFSCTGGDVYDHFNTQQIPRRLLPCLWSGHPDYVIVYKDYAGLELRMAVAWTGEPTMERLMRNNVDLHTYSGCRIYRVTPEEITKYQRMIGKILNFTLVYGAFVPTVQAMLRGWGEVLVPYEAAKEMREKWLDTYEYFKAWHEMHAKHIGVYGYLDITTALGRKVRTFTVPDSLNIPIQGSSAEVTKVSLKMLKERYPDEYLVNSIHDSNALIVHKDYADLWVSRLNECMVDAWYYVIKDLAIPDLPMPAEAEYKIHWEF